MHVDELLGQADAFAAGDYAKADAAYQQGYEHAFTMGGQLATVLLPAADVKTLATPDWQLRQGLTQLLGDHVSLVIASMRAASGDPADFTALGAQAQRQHEGARRSRRHPLRARGGQGLPVAVGRPRGRSHGIHGRLEEERRAGEGRGREATGGLRARARQAPRRGHALRDRRLGARPRLCDARRTARPRGVPRSRRRTTPPAHDLGYQAYDEMYDVSGQLSHAISLSIEGGLPKGGSQTGGGACGTSSGVDDETARAPWAASGASALAVAGALALGGCGSAAASAQGRAPESAPGSRAGSSARPDPGGPPASAGAAESFRSARTYEAVGRAGRLRSRPSVSTRGSVHLGLAPDGTSPHPPGTAGRLGTRQAPGRASPGPRSCSGTSTRRPARPFYRLAGLRPGDAVVVDRADGSSVRFRVSGRCRWRRAASPPTCCTRPRSRRCCAW